MSRLASGALVSIFWLCPCASFAQASPSEGQREASLFGTARDADPSSTPIENSLFGEQSQEQATDTLRSQNEALKETLTLGGQLFLTSQYTISDNERPENAALAAPLFLYLYLDGRPSDRVRVFARSRLDQQLMSSPQPELSSAEAQFFEQGQSETRVSLDQLWLKFDVERHLFLTIGRQPIKWGAARLWNPTDFVNQDVRDPLAIFDARLGVPLLKLHAPFEAQGLNLYALALLSDAGSPADVGLALRAELAIGRSELSASFLAKRQRPTRIGADISAGIGPFEVRLETAVRRGGRAQTWRGPFSVENLNFPTRVDKRDAWWFQGVTSIEWGVAYGDQESLFITAEYFYNHEGYDDPNLYPWLFTQGEWRPLYVGKHYAGANLALPRPGSFDNSSFVLSVLGNLSDNSYLTRFDYGVQVLTRLNINLFTAYHFGAEGEFNYALEIDPIPSIEGLENGLSLNGPWIDVGVWLSTDF